MQLNYASWNMIGNRIWAMNGIAEAETTYKTNTLNQYVSKNIRGVVPITGEADVDATVKAMRFDIDFAYQKRAITLNRSGKYFKGHFNVDNRENAVELPFKVYAFKDNGYKMEERTVTVPKAEEAFSYDADGNMLTNHGWAYTWDTENRLIAAEKDDMRLEFDYDYAGRRAFKQIYENNILTKHQRFVYNGFKLIAIYDALTGDSLSKTFIWQPVDLDVPLCMRYGGAEYYYITDGNKNVTELTDATGEAIESYKYSPFGKLLTANSEVNPFKFSSEFHDDETGLVYYNYRHYDPTLGRWLGRDPREDEDALLYIFIYNNPIVLWDDLGLKDYRLGTNDPAITPDVGAGVWNSEPKTLKLQMLRLAILADENALLLPDALAHLQHYLKNIGNTYTIRFSKMINDLKSLRDIRDVEMQQAMNFVQTLPVGIHNITSQNPSNGYAHKSDSPNWYYAVGGYSVWGKGSAHIYGGGDCFQLEFELKFYDRYNWDTGKSVTILGKTVTDEFMGKFHRQGLAKEFDMIGSIKRTIKWKRGDDIRKTVEEAWK